LSIHTPAVVVEARSRDLYCLIHLVWRPAVDFRFTPEQERLREEVRAFLELELRADDGALARIDGHVDPEQYRWFAGLLAGRGWLAPHWPEEWGGRGLGIIEYTLMREEMLLRGAPLGYGGDVNYIGPTIIHHGTDEQQRRFLPPIARGESSWAQGFTEPEAGSDPAAARTTAVLDGDDYVVNGVKMWTSGADVADYALTVVRTDPEAPKHKGLSLLAVDLKAPGIRVQMSPDMRGRMIVPRVFFENCRVPRENLVGEENRGWYLAVTTLDYERTGITYWAQRRRLFDLVVREWVHGRRAGGAVAAHRLAERRIELEVGRWMAYYIASLQAAGRVPNHEASAAFLFLMTSGQRLLQTAVDVLGPHGHLLQGSRAAVFDGGVPDSLMYGTITTVYGGSAEIQRNVIATRGLGLPRS
jgi:alkylation response protein AidB-like acyl-CoA dehydrogenase